MEPDQHAWGSACLKFSLVCSVYAAQCVSGGCKWPMAIPTHSRIQPGAAVGVGRQPFGPRPMTAGCFSNGVAGSQLPAGLLMVRNNLGASSGF